MVTPISTSYTLSDTKQKICPQCPTVAPSVTLNWDFTRQCPTVTPSVILNWDFTLGGLLSHPK